MKDKIKLALGIISGRVNIHDLDNDDWSDLGYEPYNFGALGRPDYLDVKDKAEDIIIDALKA